MGRRSKKIRRSVHDYWWKCVPVALEAKAKSGMSDRELALLITKKYHRKAGRAQVNHWFRGVREPTFSQFVLLCKLLEANPHDIISPLDKYVSGWFEYKVGEHPAAPGIGASYEIVEPSDQANKDKKIVANGGDDG